MQLSSSTVPESVQNLDLSDSSATSLWDVVTKGKGDVRALPMKKWFNTNYHYIVPQPKDTR